MHVVLYFTLPLIGAAVSVAMPPLGIILTIGIVIWICIDVRRAARRKYRIEQQRLREKATQLKAAERAARPGVWQRLTNAPIVQPPPLPAMLQEKIPKRPSLAQRLRQRLGRG